MGREPPRTKVSHILGHVDKRYGVWPRDVARPAKTSNTGDFGHFGHSWMATRLRPLRARGRVGVRRQNAASARVATVLCESRHADAARGTVRSTAKLSRRYGGEASTSNFPAVERRNTSDGKDGAKTAKSIGKPHFNYRCRAPVELACSPFVVIPASQAQMQGAARHSYLRGSCRANGSLAFHLGQCRLIPPSEP